MTATSSKEYQKRHLQFVRERVLTRDFLRLPLGEFELFDGIYNYRLHKSLCEDGSKFYRITLRGYNDSVCLFEEKIKFEDESGYEYTKLKALSSLGGITIHGDIDVYRFKSIKRFSPLLTPASSNNK